MSVGYGGGLLIVIILLMIAVLTGTNPDWDKPDN
jgi:hypothetical protein